MRIGVSLGDATEEEGDYFGVPSVEAARLCAAAEGGQIVVNELVRLVAGAGDGDRFRSLGGLELSGISEPVHAFELRWEPLRPSDIALPEQLRELPTTGYVSRVAEQGRLKELWGEARSGPLRLALISGEAGIGKTRLCAHLALYASAEGATVLYGRCDEDLGVPYQPWVQALGLLVKEASQKVLDAHVERHGSALARLVPALHERLPQLPSAGGSDPETERYLLYAAVADLLEVRASASHCFWSSTSALGRRADAVAAAPGPDDGRFDASDGPGSYRDSYLGRDHPLTALLADLHRDQGGEDQAPGLESGDVVALMEAAEGQELDDERTRACRRDHARDDRQPVFCRKAPATSLSPARSRKRRTGAGARWGSCPSWAYPGACVR